MTTPRSEAESLIELAQTAYSIDFTSTDGESMIWIAEGTMIDEDTRARALRVAPLILTADFGDWERAPGITGRIIIDSEGIFLDGDDLREDWAFGHDFDTEDLEDIGWPEPEAPQP